MQCDSEAFFLRVNTVIVQKGDFPSTPPPHPPPLTDAQLSASASLPAVGGVLFETLEGLRSDECKLHSGRGFVNLDQ